MLAVAFSPMPRSSGESPQDSRQLQRDSSRANASERRTALVIGNGAYTNAPPLKNPPNDATLVGSTLKKLGFDVTVATNRSQREMKQLIREFGQRLRAGGGVGLFYFAGHGVQSKGHNYLVPVDADIQNEADLEDVGVDVNYVLNMMDDAQSALNIVILDACRNNPFARSLRTAQGGLAQIKAPTGTLIAYATAPDSTAADGNSDNSPYTEELTRQMETPGVVLETMFRRVTEQVSRRTGGKQEPWISDNHKGEFFFSYGQTKLDVFNNGKSVLNQPTTISQAAREQALWDAIKESSDGQDFRDYLAHYPDGAYATAARAKLRHIESDKVKTDLGPPSSERSQAPRELILVKNKNHVISYSEIGEYLVFALESVGDSSAGILVDVNKNGRVDSRIDVSYGMTGDNVLCTQYLFDELYSSSCGEFKSRAAFHLEHKATERNASVHPVFTFTIPKGEMTKTGNTANVAFWFYGSGRTTYPQQKANADFSNTIEVRFLNYGFQ